MLIQFLWFSSTVQTHAGLSSLFTLNWPKVWMLVWMLVGSSSPHDPRRIKWWKKNVIKWFDFIRLSTLYCSHTWVDSVQSEDDLQRCCCCCGLLYKRVRVHIFWLLMESFDPYKAFHCLWPFFSEPFINVNPGNPGLISPPLPYPPLASLPHSSIQGKCIHLHVLNVTVDRICNQHLNLSNHRQADKTTH